jgi:hypothetical protein
MIKSAYSPLRLKLGSLSADQRAIRERCVAMRIPFVVAKSIDDVRHAFAIWGIETRESGE